MKNWNEQLEILQEQIVQQRQLQNRRKKMLQQLPELEKKEYDLRMQLDKEQHDVDQMNGRSLAVWFYAVTGKKAEKLEKEKREAYEAAVRHDAALRELESIREDLRQNDMKLREFVGCEQRYKETVEQKKESIRQMGGADAEKLEALEKQIFQCTQMQRELQEAVCAGKSADSKAQMILKELDSAEGWGTWDIVGGGIVSDVIKHEHLDSAQGHIEDLQICLRRFQTELSDVSIQANLQVNVEGFMRFADFFFDDVFSAWSVLDQVGKSKDQVRTIQQQIHAALNRLNAMQSENERAMQKARGALQALVLELE